MQMRLETPAVAKRLPLRSNSMLDSREALPWLVTGGICATTCTQGRMQLSSCCLAPFPSWHSPWRCGRLAGQAVC